MHYGPFAFTKDRSKPTIVPNKREEIGQRNGLSEVCINLIGILKKALWTKVRISLLRILRI